MIDAERILQLLEERRQQRGPVISRMESLRTAYNGDMVLPLPEIDASERQMVANLVQIGIDQISMRIASVMPHVEYPVERDGSKAAARRSRKRRDVTLGWWHRNRIGLKMRRRARWMTGYSCAPITVRCGGDREPEWRLVNPLACFPAPCLDPDDIVPPDVLNVYKRGRAWCERAYPDQLKLLRKGNAQTFEIIEYVAADEIVTVICGAPKMPEEGWTPNIENVGADVMELLRYQNRAERPLTVVPGRITLDRPLGQYDGSIGMMHMKSMFMSLGLIAQKRAIFPELWAVSGQNGGAPNIVVDAEPMSGQVGEIENGQIQQIRLDGSMLTPQWMDKLEYEMKNDSSTPSQFGGFNPTNVRTGRAMGQLQEAVIDFPIQEAQALFEESLYEEDKIAIAVAKAHEHKSVSMSVPGRGEVTYLPSETFPNDVHEVRYALQGADARGMEIAMGQKIGMGTLSKQTAMEYDPAVRDVEAEKDRLRVEQVEAAYMNALQTLASQPDGPWQPDDWTRWAELVATDKEEIWAAAAVVIKERKEAQAKEAAAQPQPGVPPGPEGMPGLDMPGQPGAGAGLPPGGIPTVAPPTGGQANLASVLAKLRLPQMQVPSEQAPRGGGVRVA